MKRKKVTCLRVSRSMKGKERIDLLSKRFKSSRKESLFFASKIQEGGDIRWFNVVRKE